MRARCFNKKNKDYRWYGKKSIKVCDEWNKSFVSFYHWAVENGYKDNLSIDRIDPSGNYEPDNCRWLPWLENVSRKNDSQRTKKPGIEASAYTQEPTQIAA
jgi:hypothetical protein